MPQAQATGPQADTLTPQKAQDIAVPSQPKSDSQPDKKKLAQAPEPKPKPFPTEAKPAATDLKPELWPKVLVQVKSQNNTLYALLHMYPVDFGDGEVTIKPRFNFHRDLFDKPAHRTIIEQAATKVYGRPVKVTARTDEAITQPSHKPGDPNSELVTSALEILGGEIVD